MQVTVRNLLSSLLAGAGATLAHAALMTIKHRAGILPGFEPYDDMQRLLSSVSDWSFEPPWSWLISYVNGALVLGFLFGRLFAYLPGRTSVVKGAAFGLAAWLAMGLGFFPLAGRGVFAYKLGLGGWPAVLTLAMLMLYAIVMSLLYARLTNPRRAESARAAGAGLISPSPIAYSFRPGSSTTEERMPDSHADSRTGATHHRPMTRRWREQRWLLDNTIRAVGMDWDQPRSVNLSAACGPRSWADFAALRTRIQKFADISPAFEAVARHREGAARAALEARDPVSARENYFMAAIHWGAAQWPIDEASAQNQLYNARKRECYGAYGKLADHHVEEAWIPLPDGKRLPAWLHLPPRYAGGRIPAVISVPGMDSFKEMGVSMYGDRWLERGIAVLTLDGPGQYESPLLGIFFSMPAWQATGKACCDWLAARAEIDPQKIGISGNSFGSFFSTIAAAHEPRLRAVAVSAVCHEPGFRTIFEEASPTFKMRFMFMSGFGDEAEFDEFRKTMTWEGHAELVRVPYLCMAGEHDELSPLEHTERLMKTLKGPKRWVVYQDSRHSLGGAPAANLGPFPPAHAADWMLASLSGKTFPDEKWFVTAGGQIVKTPL